MLVYVPNWSLYSKLYEINFNDFRDARMQKGLQEEQRRQLDRLGGAIYRLACGLGVVGYGSRMRPKSWRTCALRASRDQYIVNQSNNQVNRVRKKTCGQVCPDKTAAYSELVAIVKDLAVITLIEDVQSWQREEREVFAVTTQPRSDSSKFITDHKYDSDEHLDVLVNLLLCSILVNRKVENYRSAYSSWTKFIWSYVIRLVFKNSLLGLWHIFPETLISRYMQY